ncbi:MAG: ABC transporter permease [Bryobacterales bacterium]|nr:ABC transporter permease [Bryobacterales bacterium]
MTFRVVVHHLCLLLFTLLICGLLGATLVRYAPGFGAEERDLDARYSAESRTAFRLEREREERIVPFYVQHLFGLLHGEFGRSRIFDQPVRELLADRLPVTMRAVSLGLLTAWSASLLLALPGVSRRRAWCDMAPSVLAGTLLSVPAALLGLAFFLMEWPAWAALTLVVFPRIFRYVRNLLEQSAAAPAVLQARAAGLREGRILLLYVILPVLPELLAVAGVSAGQAFSAAIPLEALCGVAGVGSLAWQAALGRDLPLLINVTMMVALIVLAANAIAEIAVTAVHRRAA